MQINNETLRAFRSALMDTVKPLEEKYGVKIEMGNITYSSDSFHFKVTILKKTATEIIKKSNVLMDKLIWLLLRKKLSIGKDMLKNI